MPTGTSHSARRYEELRPDDLAAIVRDRPVAYWPLGLLEHHSWHLPIGFDGIKADRFCQRMAQRTGGVILPVMWWGANGGHGPFLWTHYQDPAAAGQIAATTVRQLLHFGFHAIILVAGHYPWDGILNEHLSPIRAEHPNSLLIWGTEASLAGWELGVHGDHAAREETSFGLALLPELVKMDALHAGRGPESWPNGNEPNGIPDVVRRSPDDPCFSQAGEDARLATADHGNESLQKVIAIITARVNDFLDRPT